MKILSQKKIKNIRDSELDKVKAISDYIYRRTKELNIFNLDIEKEKKVILEDFVKFAENIANQKSDIQDNAHSIEEKRDMSFNALSRLSLEAEYKFRSAKDIETKTILIEQGISNRESKIEQRNNDMDEREQIINTRALSLSRRSESITVEEADLENLKIKTNSELLIRENKIRRQEQSIIERLNELSLSAQANVKTSELLKEREKNFLEEIKKEKTLLADGRATLERAYADLKSKQK